MEPSGYKKSEKIKYQKMPEIIKEQLMDWIMDGTIQMGEKLNAEDLATRMGVSRMPVREALSNMEKSGIVHSKPYVGTRVTELQMTDIVQIYLMRKALEPLAGYYACKNITDVSIQKIIRVHEELTSVISEPAPNAKQIFVLNRKLHFEIYRASKMGLLVNTIAALWDNLAFYKLIYGRKYVTDQNSAKAMIDEHSNYIDKLENRDAEGIKVIIRDALHKHVLELKDQVTYEIEKLVNYLYKRYSICYGENMDYDMKECGGCSTCEIACSYKHTGEFNHAVSSIEIVELEDAPGYKVRITEDQIKDRIACDGCLDVDGDPLCVQYCRKKDDLRTIIEHFKTQCLHKNKGRHSNE